MIQIRDVPDELHRALRIRAAEAGLSLSAFLRRELETIAERRSVEAVLSELAGKRTHVPVEEIVEVIREDRQ
jgi:plasmid stability protein